MKARAAIVTSVLVIASVLVADADAAIYWSSSTDVGRVNLDGSLFDPKFVETDSLSSCGIEVDSSHVYWTDSYSGRIGRANLDGTNVDSEFIAPAGKLPCDLALDSNFIYWTDMGGDTIGRAQLDGSNVDTDFISTAEHPCGIAVNQTAIYWSSDQEGMIWRTDLRGLNAPEVVVNEATTPCGVALNGRFLFWGESDPGKIVRANLDGSEPLPGFMVGGEFPSDIEIDDRHIFWVNAGWGFKSIGWAELDGGNVNQRFLGGLDYPYALAVDGVQVMPPVAIPRPMSRLRIGKVKRNRYSGAVFVGVDLFESGVFHASAKGTGAKLSPDVYRRGRFMGAGRKWLRIVPVARRGSGCQRSKPKRGRRVKVTLDLSFAENGKEEITKSKKLISFRIGCQARA